MAHQIDESKPKYLSQTRFMSGRRIIKTSVTEITNENVVDVLRKALATHELNRSEIDYLWKYYRGDQPIRNRVKDVRPEICNKITENRANEIVSFKVGYLCGEPIQYVSRNGGEEIVKQINTLNEYMFAEDKAAQDQELVEWQMICGTAFRLVLPDEPGEEDEAPFELYTLDPRDTFVVYSNEIGNKPLMAVKYSKDDNEIFHYSIYTENRYYLVDGDILVESKPHALDMIPIIEYPGNNMENGVIGYFDFINIPNYKNLKGVTDPRKYLENIKADGYATSHKYVDNLMRVIETWHLTDYDKKEETKMSNSPLVVYTKLSTNHSGQRTHSIDRITPHCVVGQLSAESICGCFISTSRQASCNYGIGTDGRISMSVEEKNRSWCSSSRENDQRAVTIECASDKTAPYAFNDAVYASLVNLCVDICQRNGKSKLLWLGDKNKTLAYVPKSDEMVLTVHRWFANKSCPGDWLYNRLGNLAAEVTKRLTGGSTDTGKVDVPSDGKTLYRVQTGAFSKRSNADAWAAKLKAAGFDTYIVQMGNLYKVQVGAYSQKSNAENMMAKLKAAGYDAFITTKSGTAAGTAKKSAAEIAKEIYNGTCSDARWSSWGNGADRVNRLKQAGYDPSEVQSEVNKLF